ncbi:PLP-dependent cysteine synthase family protein [Halorussus halophilus]|uniref:PLP-dependent cysteine synthase family protein n=1 Tax=Halorussus halophilus TaxID=2650975 RepID=UPI0013013590|nr:PLP-dependent cysteine synthase family protein [Halorussus halophilus]
MQAQSVIGAIGNTPLVELESVRPEGGARVFAKWEGANPTGSMKDRMALSAIENAERDGDLEPGQRVVELTGGSTGASLALVCSVTDHPLSIVSADCFAEEKIRMMRALGADVTVMETPEGKIYPGIIDDMERLVEEIIEDTGAYYHDQFNNPHLPAGYAGLAEEILADCPDLTDFVMGVGTGACSMGTARVFRENSSNVDVTLVEPEESPVLSRGETGSHNVEGVAVGFEPPHLEEHLYDDVVAIPEAEGRWMTRQIAAEDGLFAGTSTGLNIAAAKRVAAGRPEDAAVVTVAVDTGLKYLDGDLYREE